MCAALPPLGVRLELLPPLGVLTLLPSLAMLAFSAALALLAPLGVLTLLASLAVLALCKALALLPPLGVLALLPPLVVLPLLSLMPSGLVKMVTRSTGRFAFSAAGGCPTGTQTLPGRIMPMPGKAGAAAPAAASPNRLALGVTIGIMARCCILGEGSATSGTLKDPLH